MRGCGRGDVDEKINAGESNEDNGSLDEKRNSPMRDIVYPAAEQPAGCGGDAVDEVDDAGC